MILEMSLETFTLIHVLISLAEIATGIVVMYGFFTDQGFDRWTTVFLITTALTSVTGFLFPFTAVTPAIRLGVLSLLVLSIASVTPYILHLTWRKTYVTAACTALYFNVFVLVVQSFEKGSIAESACPNPERTTVCTRANYGLTTLCHTDNIRSEEIPHCHMIFANIGSSRGSFSLAPSWSSAAHLVPGFCIRSQKQFATARKVRGKRR